MTLDNYDREGDVISLGMWCLLRELPHYFRVALTRVGGTEVSTVWIGMDLGMSSFYGGPPQIFETMVFSKYDHLDLACWRWSTEAQAIAGHDQVVAEVRGKHHRLVKYARDERRRKMKARLREL